MRAAALLVVFVSLVGAAPAPIQSAALPDVCSRIPTALVRPLLFGDAGGTLDSWSSRSGDGTLGCTWRAQPQGGGLRSLTLTVRDYADAAAAHGAVAGGAAVDGAADAELAHKGVLVAVARHGATVATLDGSAAGLDGDDAVTLLDPAALAAVGVAIPAKPAGDTAQPLAAGDGGWTPPAHDTGWWGRVLGPLVAALDWLASWRFAFIMVLVVGGLFGGFLIGKRLSARVKMTLGFLLGAFAIYNIIFGTTVADLLTYWIGTSAPATITDSFGTATQYNNHDVRGYNVLIRTSGGVVRTSFQDDDFNVYPPHNATTYPSTGDLFTVRYVPGFPSRFVIVANDASPWARGLSCGRLSSAVDAAQRNLDFAPGDARSQRTLQAAQHDLSEHGCDGA